MRPPDGFLWGSATSAHQVEGGNTNNDWWDFEHDPATAAVQSSGDGIDHLHAYAEDFALLSSLGHNAHRLSLEWSRLEPAPGEFSRAAVGHYRRVLTALAGTGMTAVVTLHHFTLPRWFAARGGWLAPDAATVFARYCRFVTAELGHLMPLICTINEPQMIALHGYLEGYHPPGIADPVLWKRAGGALLDAHRAAVDAVRATGDAPVGLAVQLPLLAPARDDDACQSRYELMRYEIVDRYLDDPGGDWLGVQYYRKQWVDPASPTGFAARRPGCRAPRWAGRYTPTACVRCCTGRRGPAFPCTSPRTASPPPTTPSASPIWSRTSPRCGRPWPRAPTCADICTGRRSTISSGARDTAPGSA